MPDSVPPTQVQGGRIGPLALSLGICAIAAVTVSEITKIPTPLFGGPVDPRTFPAIVAAGLAFCGIGLLLQALRGRLQSDDIKWRARSKNILWFLAGLTANLILVEPVGFVVASTVMFVCIARGFGSRRILLDAAFGLVFALAVYLGFRFLLGVSIGSGLLGGLW